MLTESMKQTLLAIARESIRSQLDGSPEEQMAELRQAGIPDELLEENGLFVTLKKRVVEAGGLDLRGCIGNIIGHSHLYESVRRLAIESAFSDPRFEPVSSVEELGNLQIEISVLTQPKAVDSYREILIGRDGIVLRRGFRSAVFLPQVAVEQGWGLEETLTHLSMKAGLGLGAWREPECTFQTFQAEVFAESD